MNRNVTQVWVNAYDTDGEGAFIAEAMWLEDEDGCIVYHSNLEDGDALPKGYVVTDVRFENE